MKNTIKLLAVAALLPLATVGQQTPPAGGKPKDIVLAKPVKLELPNGLRANLVTIGTVPKTYINIIVKTGSIHQAEGEQWLAQMTARLMREGSTTLNGDALNNRLADIGGYLSVVSSDDAFTVYGDVLSENAPELVRILADVLINPQFPIGAQERYQRELLGQYKQTKANPQAIAQNALAEALYPGNPYGRRLPKSEEDIQKLTAERVRAWYQAQFGGQRTTVYVTGVFDVKATEAAIKQHLTALPKGPAETFPPAEVSPQQRILPLDRAGAPQSTLILAMPSVKPNPNDYIQFQVMNTMLGGSFGSRITRNIREDKGYTYSPYSQNVTHPGGAYWSEVADVTTQHTGASVTEIAGEIRRLQNEAPPEQELEAIKSTIIGGFIRANSSPFGIMSMLNTVELYDLPDSYLSGYVQKVQSLTPAQVQQAARKLDLSKASLVVLGDPAEIQKQMPAIKAALQQGQ